MNILRLLLYVPLLEIRRLVAGEKYIAEVDVTDNCNLRCKHCYHFHGKDVFQNKEIPIETWEQRFRELYSSGIRLLLMVGGEPALRKDVLMLANNMFPVVSVITNGTIKIPKEFNNRLIVSIDGSQKTSDSIRGEGTFARVLKNYSGDKRVVINMVLMKDNYKELEDVVKIAKSHGFRGVICNINTRGMDLKDPKLMKERKNIINELKRVKSLYPKELLLSKSTMIKWYEQPDHSDSCYWGDETLHFDVSWNKRRCFFESDCTNCGCFAGTFQSPLKTFFHPKEAIRIFSV